MCILTRWTGILIASLAWCSIAAAQTLLTAGDARKLDRLFLSTADDSQLACRAEIIKPFVDFSFRLETGIALACPLRLFDGKETLILSAVRATTENGEQHTFAEKLVVPSAPAVQQGQRPLDIRKVQSEMLTSTGFIVGEGSYRLEVALLDAQERVFRKHWDIKAELKGKDKQVKILQEPNRITPLQPHFWNGKLEGKGSGLRVTVLLDAASANPFSASLRQWDRTLLLDTVSSLLRNLPCESVRLVAFSLEQQREIFRADQLQGTDMPKLASALRQLELGTVSVNVLRESEGWAKVLADVTRQELEEGDRSDAVIFVGPSVRFSSKIARQMLPELDSRRSRFFYFEYYPPWRRTSRFPDSIEHLVNHLDGETFRISSPGDLAAAIDSVHGQLLKPGADSSKVAEN